MKKMITTLLILALTAVILTMQSCQTPAKAYLIGTVCSCDKGEFTVLSAEFSDKVSVDNGEEIVAPEGKTYAVVKMKICMSDGNWSDIKEFEFRETVVNAKKCQLLYDITGSINGFSIFEYNSTDCKVVTLVFETEDDHNEISRYNLEIYFTDGGSTQPFSMIN